MLKGESDACLKEAVAYSTAKPTDVTLNMDAF
eukprot:CAMPEP_0174301484 /NCGR_PEP_ID=MMETSP0809-20121228/59072_1 /TAXON_ID=73025 ORGANISM="Eutreptiella gymnastica-like, Strain CCMP1594" /NCGR_SAMPLE_ID=MMETSP0809 /ASSEMBLY_ACC=CAM_ASM_000658 /LENGTH=31 /DNA_ID= /DNA_START= /DNA_END= /DNA_ORIENTATION=